MGNISLVICIRSSININWIIKCKHHPCNLGCGYSRLIHDGCNGFILSLLGGAGILLSGYAYYKQLKS